MRSLALLLLVGCGSGEGGTFDAAVTVDGSAETFAASCTLRNSDGFHRAFAEAGDTSFEIVWRDEVVDPGEYAVTGLVSDDVIVYYDDPTLPTIASLAGTVTFATLDESAEGTFELTGDDDLALVASGSFDCR